jgi:biopolymer transport protein ExbB/TolQ
MKRTVFAGVSGLLGGGLVVVLHVTLSETLALVLLDKGGTTYPYSIQNGMWIVFMIGLGELAYRLLEAGAERRELDRKYLPEDETTVLVKSMLPRLYKNVSLADGDKQLFLPGLIKRILTAFQTTESVENASAVLTSSIELRSHDLEVRYSMIRYIVWLIPTLGFIGTVVGIALALSYAGQPGQAQDPELLTELTLRLAVAFNTTLVALVMSGILVFIMHVAQAKEELTINRCGQYCLDNLVNRLYRGE